MVVSSWPRRDLLLRILFAVVSDQGTHRPSRNPARARLSRCCRGAAAGLAAMVVRADGLVVVFQRSCPDGSLLVAPGRFRGDNSQSLAAGLPGGMFCLLSFLRGRCSVVLRLSIGRHAARSRIHFHLLCSAWPSTWARSGPCTLPSYPVSVSVGLFPNL